MAAIGWDLTIIGFIVVALIALGFLWLSRRDRWRAIRFGFFFEHERRRDEDVEEEEHTRIMWPGERGEKEKGE